MFKYFPIEGVEGQRERLLFVNFFNFFFFFGKYLWWEGETYFEGKMSQLSLITDVWGQQFKAVPLSVQSFDAFNLMYLSLLAKAEVLEDTVCNVLKEL